MSRIVPDGFATISQTVDELVVAMYSGIPDRPIVRDLKEKGYDVTDGEARQCANEWLWVAVDSGGIEALCGRAEEPNSIQAFRRYDKRNSCVA